MQKRMLDMDIGGNVILKNKIKKNNKATEYVRIKCIFC